MTSRERVVAALSHQETDRAPVDMGGMRSTGATALAYGRLKQYLGIPRPDDPLSLRNTRVYDIVQQLAEPDEEILDRFGVDVVDLSRAFYDQPEDWQPWTLPDGSPALIPAWLRYETEPSGDRIVRSDDGTIIARMVRDAYYFNQEHHPLSGAETPAEFGDLAAAQTKVSWSTLACPPWHKPLGDPEHFADVRRRAQHLRDSSDRAIMAALGGSVLEASQYLRGFDVFLMDLAMDPSLAEALMDRLVEGYLEIIPRFFEAVGDSIQIVQMGDDMGTQLAPQISPEMYRSLIKPRHQVIYEAVHKHFDGFLFLHSCGEISELIPDLIEIGVDVLNPVQTSCPGMEPDRLKREFGKDIAFWGGGCETQSTLRAGTPDEVRREVRERIRVFSVGGGYVFCQVHNILPEAPPENVVAMYEAAAGSV